MTTFQSLLLPPTRFGHVPRTVLPGVAYWPYAEDPRAVPWLATHRIHFTSMTGPGSVDVMWVRLTDVSCNADFYCVRNEWHGFEREQWVPGGCTGWVFSPDSDHPGSPHRLLRTDPWQGDRQSLVMERIDHAASG